MRRADRLFHIIQLVRGRRLTTAAWLAQRLEVSERTIYRDIADLQFRPQAGTGNDVVDARADRADHLQVGIMLE
ncbi:MAG: HTH domain-containing protein, partial [Ramlibacter sp.]